MINVQTVVGRHLTTDNYCTVVSECLSYLFMSHTGTVQLYMISSVLLTYVIRAQPYTAVQTLL